MRTTGCVSIFLIAFALVLNLGTTSAFAQDTQEKYQRKSISYVDAVLKLGNASDLMPKQERTLLEVIRREIEMPRFDYNALPSEIVDAFKRDALRRGVQDIDALTEAMNEVLVPEILRIVDIAKEMRAQDLVSEAAQHSFVVEKAKETGITAEDLEAIMNSAYIYLPVLTQVKVHDSKATNTVNYDLRGGIIWFAVRTDEAGTRVELLIKDEAVGKGAARRDAKFKYKGRRVNGPEYAFITAAEVLAQNLKIAAQKIPDFQLTNPLADTGPGWVEFPMGKREGLGVDDKFIIAEFYEEGDGSLKRQELGMVRVARVADNVEKKANSRARTVIGGGYERGMLALEHPRLPIDLSFRFGVLPVSVKDGYGWFDDEITSNFYTGQLWFNYNLAQTTNISQFFASVYGELGSGTLKGWEMWGENVPAGLYWGVGGGLVKKFYVNRLHIGLEALISFADYSFSGTGTDPIFNKDWNWETSSLGFTFNGDIELALSYDWNLGAGVSYRLFAPTKDWTYHYDNEKIDLSGITDLPELDFSGLGYQIYLTWSLPSLGYDPVKMARGAIGH
ncbi:hypothetical protein CEE37_01345 [candidate division LCP-89 bacterium B3_LCP]|uniref:Uncharacterized protein n=1 Tax=candidate division LCP-89 bacterium B3_LCP TaxID=2012998 RepID=A0A532V575_UNCL8|nr:MAG: hypothetical protein CEE37_01345 [candidate division LCP-89 bacterium B3_LCP]